MPTDITARLAANADVIRKLCRGVTGAQARRRFAPDQWSLLEVINHLDDEEREDFRTRVEYTLYRPGQAWPPIHPSAWVEERHYNARSLQPSLESFLAERARSIAWLNGLVQPNWETSATHPSAGVLTAGDLLASWLAHDFLHIRQLNEWHYRMHAAATPTRRVDYAGEW